MRHFAWLAVVLCILMGCKEDANSPYLEFVGGGFIFNYRTADAYYGFVGKPLRNLPEGSVIEARFELPHAAAPYVETQKTVPGMMQFSFRTPQLTGIEKGHPYKAVMRLLAAPGGAEIARYETTFSSDMDQAGLPSKPLVVGPGYQANPD